MNIGPPVRLHYDRLLLVLAAAGLLVSGGWWWRQDAGLRRIRATPVAVRSSASRYEPASWPPPPSVAAGWNDPAAQSPGAGWIYDVFTPPVIYYNGSTKTFSVEPARKAAGPDRPFAIELVGVKRESYRLQLAGYFGGPGDYRVVFTSPKLSGTLLAREGQHFDQLGLSLKKFAVQKVAASALAAVREVAAVAVLQDETLDDEVTLDSRSTRLTDVPLAVCRLLADNSWQVELREGDSFSDGLSFYQLEHVQLDPASVVIVRRTPGSPLVETRSLRPTAGPTAALSGEPSQAGPLPKPPSPAIAPFTHTPPSHE